MNVNNIKNIKQLIPSLRIPILPVKRKLRNFEGPKGRLEKIGKTITELIKKERIEVNYHHGQESRVYAERVS